MTDRYFGKYRGMVLNNVDPMQQGRLQVQVPDVTGLVPSSWAMPCVPVAGLQSGMMALPIIGSGVWIEYEQGNPDPSRAVGTRAGNGPPPVPRSVDLPGASGHLFVPMYQLKSNLNRGEVKERKIRCTHKGAPVLETVFRLEAV